MRFESFSSVLNAWRRSADPRFSISPEGASDSSPRREPWDPNRVTKTSPGGAKESGCQGNEGDFLSPLPGLCSVWSSPFPGLTPWARLFRPPGASRGRQGQGGLTLVELIVAVTLLAILSLVAMPLARVQLKRERERELRAALREMRTAIDRYKDAADRGMIQVELGTEGYPKSMDVLVEGVKMNNSPQGKRLKFLRRIPRDPMTNSTEWGVRSYQDEPDSTSSSGENVFDVYSKSQGTALDGSKYSEW